MCQSWLNSSSSRNGRQRKRAQITKTSNNITILGHKTRGLRVQAAQIGQISATSCWLGEPTAVMKRHRLLKHLLGTIRASMVFIHRSCHLRARRMSRMQIEESLTFWRKSLACTCLKFHKKMVISMLRCKTIVPLSKSRSQAQTRMMMGSLALTTNPPKSWERPPNLSSRLQCLRLPMKKPHRWKKKARYRLLQKMTVARKTTFFDRLINDQRRS